MRHPGDDGSLEAIEDVREDHVDDLPTELCNHCCRIHVQDLDGFPWDSHQKSARIRPNSFV